MTKNKIINLKHPTNTNNNNNNYIQFNNQNNKNIVNNINIINNNIIIKNNNSPPPPSQQQQQQQQHSCLCHTSVANLPVENLSSTTYPFTQSAENLSTLSPPKNNTSIITYHTPTQTSYTCAACRYFRRKCPQKCLLSPYFPPQKQQDFLNAHKLFGVSFMIKTLKAVHPMYCDDAMTSIIYSANARARDPVGGCLRIIHTLVAQLKYVQAELDYVRDLNRHFRAQLQPVHLLHSSDQVCFQNDINLPDNLPSYNDIDYEHFK